jgi:hypothetical protein
MAISLPVWLVIAVLLANLLIYLRIGARLHRLRVENTLLHGGWVKRGELWYPDGWSGRPGFGPDDDPPGLSIAQAYYWHLRYIDPQIPDNITLNERTENAFRR